MPRYGSTTDAYMFRQYCHVTGLFPDSTADSLTLTAGTAANSWAKTAAGTHDGGNDSAALIDADAYWIDQGVRVGMTVTNVTDGSTGTITAVTQTNVTATLSGGAENLWDNGDEATITNTNGWVRVKDSAGNYLDTNAATMRLSLSAISTSNLSVADKNYAVEIGYGDETSTTTTVIARLRTKTNSAGANFNVPQTVKQRSLCFPVGTKVFYRLRCETGASTGIFSFRWFN